MHTVIMSIDSSDTQITPKLFALEKFLFRVSWGGGERLEWIELD